jgi:hypothetical protein
MYVTSKRLEEFFAAGITYPGGPPVAALGTGLALAQSAPFTVDVEDVPWV